MGVSGSAAVGHKEPLLVTKYLLSKQHTAHSAPPVTRSRPLRSASDQLPRLDPLADRRPRRGRVLQRLLDESYIVNW